MVEEWKSWCQALVGGEALAALDFAIPEVVFPHKTITLGPVKSGDSQAATYTIQIAGVADASKVKLAVDASIDLPEGLSLSIGVVDGDRPDRKVLELKVDGSQGFRAAGKGKYEGLLKIAPAPDSSIVFKTIPVQLAITARGQVLPSQILVPGIIVILAGGFVAGAGYLLRTKKAERPKPHRVIGRLIVINDATGGRIGTINLEEISTKSSRLSLVVGSSRTAEVRLKHASVSPDHCTLEANLVDGRLVTYVEPIGPAKVVVNGEVIRSKTSLGDGAKIEIGDFVYQFEDTQLYKKVDVVYKNGKQLSGILDIAGMDAEGFKISPTDAVSPSERARVKFSDVRSVTFHRRAVDVLARKPRPPAKLESMKRVELMFKKGSTIRGCVQREYAEGRHRYVELLPLELDSDIDYTVVDYSSVVEKKAI
ncbi:MAG: FHA domain-containing protein [Candidatus Lindowbacteria bacterium]|nr:FHA domain-containing protein [Candidatus Lindowbacteria bacterium]